VDIAITLRTSNGVLVGTGVAVTVP
jgi:hypothetical protein